MLVGFLACAATGAFCTSAAAEPLRVYETQRISGSPPRIDGHIDEAVWDQVSWAGDFTQREPYPGQPPTEQTQFKILYDDDALYLAYRAFDSQPDKIVALSARRDYFPGDWVEVNIDSNHDRRTAFSFTSSVSGVKGDEFVSEDGNNWDGNWDPIWFLATAIDSEGWTAEVKIPLSQLRFGNEPEQVWGIEITRRIFRQEERSNWQFIPRDATGWVSGFGELRGLRDLRPRRQVELLPYAVTRAESFAKQDGNPFATGSDQAVAFGLDGKIGLTSDLTLDLTANPDFGQVEADPSEVNLSAFETFFDEKRPFFIEGSSILDFPLAPAVTGGSFTQDNLFYSRRIGRAPQGFASTADGEYSDSPDHSSILGAAKMSGKTSRGWSIGVLEAVTAEENADIDGVHGKREQVVEPATNYFVGRVQRDYDHGQTAVGGMFTAVNRRTNDAAVDFLHTAAYTGGLDVRHDWHDRTYFVAANLDASHIRGSREAILRTQTASARYYQRPDADYVSVDSTRTSLSGGAGAVRFGKQSRGHVRFETGVAWRTPGFETNDLGYLRRADEINQFGWGNYRIETPFSIFRRLAFNVNEWVNYDFGGTHLSNSANTNFNANFLNNYQCGGGLTRDFAYVSNTELRGGPSSRWPGGWNPNYWVNSDSRRKIYYGFGGSWYIGDDDFYWSRDEWVDLTVRPNNQIRVTLSPSHSKNRPELQYVGRRQFEGQDRYLFASLDQETVALTLRLDYAVTPDLTIQYYGAPFVSAGEYRDFKRITDPRADHYEDRFVTLSDQEISRDEASDSYEVDEDRDGTADYGFGNPDFNYREFNSNLVARWEFSPGSSLYLVWSQGRVDFTSDGHFSARDGVDELFHRHPHDIFLVKVSRWFSL
ncbi:MAG: carbohydrate binding family 9 domain-containing protein [Candidatus Eisenbacteria bacterium]|uniref:Carbohydrate binding family 9 domain-containing protein n=1 Tax=Eiseniibacteriota bacterium TaxID=2212470 RepID=A0A956LY96_UNCEI|nr:carbohydrate binding family 9 domain-containing protein [Candidatus Eisenbacteria bacterium]